LAAGLRPDPLGELQRSPDPLAAMGVLLLREGEGNLGKHATFINLRVNNSVLKLFNGAWHHVTL